MELKGYFDTFKRWWWLVLLVAALAGLVASILSSLISPTYQAATTLTINRRDAAFDDLETSERLAGTYVELMHKRPLLEAVIANLQLGFSPEDLARRIRGTVGRETLLIELTVNDSDPYRAAAIANEMVRELSRQGRELLGSNPIAARSSLQVIEVARPELTPIQPRPLRNIVLATVLGTLLAGGGALLLEALDNRVRQASSAAQLLGVPVLASIGEIRKFRTSDKLILSSHAFSPAVEAYSLLRAQLERPVGTQPIQTIVVTSSTPLEGKSMTAANLAISLARSGKQVILVDTNLRTPTLHRLFQQPDTYGVTSILERLAAEVVREYALPTGMANLRLLPSGPLPLAPSDLLGSPLMTELIEALRAQADVIVFDSPPILGVVDALLLARASDITLMVVLANTTRADALRQAREEFDRFQISPLGVVFNGAPLPRLTTYGMHYRRARRRTRLAIWLTNLTRRFTRLAPGNTTRHSTDDESTGSRSTQQQKDHLPADS